MAATARSELYDGLVRKIGYSVGLEFLRRRVADLVELYLSGGNVDGADWRQLVQTWGRKSPRAEQDIADVYASLQLIRRYNSAVHVLPSLEVLGILYSHCNPDADESDEKTQTEALNFVLALRILEADGDIFLNALSADFAPKKLQQRLQALIRYKRAKVKPLFKQAGAIRKVMEAISIKNQTESDGKPKRMSYAEQSRILWSNGGPSRTIDWSDQDIYISDDYAEKVCTTRRGWAEDLGLFDKSDGKKTELGRRLLQGADDIGLAFELNLEKGYAFWPYGHELRKMSLPPEKIGVKEITPWSIIRMLIEIFVSTNRGKAQHQSSADRKTIVGMLTEIHSLYRSVDRRGSIRHDLPLFIAEPVLAFWMWRSGRGLPDFRNFFREEIARPDRLVDFVMIRGTEGGLRLMVEASGHGKRG